MICMYVGMCIYPKDRYTMTKYTRQCAPRQGGCGVRKALFVVEACLTLSIEHQSAKISMITQPVNTIKLPFA